MELDSRPLLSYTIGTMKVGDLVQAWRTDEPTHRAWTELGVIVGTFDHPTATCGREWFRVAINNVVLVFRENYLEVVSAAR